jgi:uncharacterized C2H2 Zn-finger protein
MSSLWQRQGDSGAGGSRWKRIALGASILRVSVGDGEILLTRFGGGTEIATALLAATGSRLAVNGLPVLSGLKVLEHRDEITASGARFVFSEESLPEVFEFHPEPLERELRCSLCRGAIQDGMTVVRCPRCGRLFHQTSAGSQGPERHCWTYSERCRHCEHPTALSEECLWSPENEDDDAAH